MILTSDDFHVGQKVQAKVELLCDLTDIGCGVQCYAQRGDILIVRKVSSGFLNCISVSHENVTNSTFCAAPNELDPLLI